MAVPSIFLCFLCLAAAALVLGQTQTGYVSIDCGSPTNNNYIDTDNGISYTSDGGFISTGISKNISSEYSYPKVPNLPFPLSDLRSFPQGNKNCYTLNPVDGKGNLYLIRASFLYGDYDGLNKPPEFDLYLNVNFWSLVKFRNVSEIVVREIVSFADSDTIYVCLVSKGLGTPFISGLELRPLNNSIYGTEFGTNASLVLYKRLDTGYLNGTGRYKDDIFDRIWSPYTSISWDSVKQTVPINNYEDGYRPPRDVINTAATPQSDDEPLELYWTSENPKAHYYAYLYFAELDKLEKNETRRMEIFWNGSPVSGIFSPVFLYATTISNSRAFMGKEHWISIQKTAASTLPPILNAIEIYAVQFLDQLPTAKEDVDVIQNIRSMYQIKKFWMGDPCAPKNYPWEGLGCNYNSFPRIISLNLSSSGLSGQIVNAIGNLSLLESLDLSNNSLDGPVPEFLNDLEHLKFLNLKGNNFSGFVPKSLMKRSKVGALTLSLDAQNLCLSDSCQDKDNKVIPAVIAASVFGLMLVLVIIWILQRKGKSGSYSRPLVASNKRRFSSNEVLNITSNFQKVIGKGGFGTVYLGCLEDGSEVAVKMINASSSETSKGGSSTRGSKEFQVEAELLLKVHHRNLASFVGYCDDGPDMALIYEYMANGNLQEYLSTPKAENLSWKMRLHIARDAAQGLEYLHHGCKPPIVHRDVKTANILLSENLDAKIADFGLSKVFPDDNYSHVVTAVMGTPGYVDPEYYNTYKLNEKSDVYGFGVVLLELITGQQAIIKTEDGDKINVVHWVEPFLETGEINGAVDHRLKGDFDLNSAWKFLELAMSCVTEKGSSRPTMSDIVAELKHCLAMESSETQELKKNEESYGRYQYESPESLSWMGRRDLPITGPMAR